MTFLQFLIDTPAVAFMLLLVLLVTVVLIAAALLSRKKPGHTDGGGMSAQELPTTRFMGTQMGISILIFGLVPLLGVIGWVRKIFSVNALLKNWRFQAPSAKSAA